MPIPLRLVSTATALRSSFALLVTSSIDQGLGSEPKRCRGLVAPPTSSSISVSRKYAQTRHDCRHAASQALCRQTSSTIVTRRVMLCLHARACQRDTQPRDHGCGVQSKAKSESDRFFQQIQRTIGASRANTFVSERNFVAKDQRARERPDPATHTEVRQAQSSKEPLCCCAMNTPL